MLLLGVLWGVWLSQGMFFHRHIKGLSSQGTGFEGDLDSLALASPKTPNLFEIRYNIIVYTYIYIHAHKHTYVHA